MSRSAPRVTPDEIMVQAAIGVIFAGLSMILLFSVFAYRNMAGIPREVLAARSAIHFDQVARGIALFTIGFFSIILGQLPTLLELPFAAPALVVGSGLWIVLMAGSLRTLYWSVRIPRDVRVRYLHR